MPHKKSRKVRRGKKTGRKTMKGKRGGYYGFGQTTPVAPGAASVTTGHEVAPLKGGRRSRKSRSRKMRGGSSIGTVTGAAFKGPVSGVNGVADYKPFNAGFSNDVIPT
jgi:hypothetical protein